MRLNGELADPELAADLLVQLAGNDQIHHLPLAVAECFITVTKGACLGFRAKRDFTARNRLGDRAQKLVAVEWFDQELDGAPFIALAIVGKSP